MRFGPLGPHLKLVGRLAGIVATASGWVSEQVHLIESAAVLHDMGKFFLDQKILGKAGPLSDDERQNVQLHPELGWAYLMAVPRSPLILLGAKVSLEHHERWDGKGYPFGKAGDAIDPASRIVSICDAYAALRERRAYKPDYSHKVALGKLMDLTNGSGAAFDPHVLQTFAECEAQIEAIYLQRDRLPDLDLAWPA